jgi:CRISPR-associated protein Csx17
MSWNFHTLGGCAPTPLAHYLKALGILRLVGQQKDPEVRAHWQQDDFVLITRLTREDIERFFLEEYAPTPMLTPWNGGSGFYPKDQKAGIEAISSSSLERFSGYREAIEIARTLVGGRAESSKDKDEKAALLKACKAQWRGAALEWVNAATVITKASEIAYPAILGSGGNDGRLDFANNFMQRLVELLPVQDTDSVPATSGSFVRNAIWGTPLRGLRGAPIGQFLPGGAGGLNGTTGFVGNPQVNPWDYVLMLEGAMLLQVTSVRRLDGAGGFGLPQASAPFAVRSSAEGYASAAPADESARGEQWFPLWQRPASLREVAALFNEGRLQVGPKRADEALEAAQALSRLGVTRGVSSFQRFGYAERNGQANLAVPLGRWRVSNKPHVQLLDEIQDWVSRLHRAGEKQTAFGRHARKLERTMLSICAQSAGNAGPLFEQLLEALGDAEAEMVRRPRATVDANLRPIPILNEAWLGAVDHPTREFRLAHAISTQVDVRDRSTLRSHFASIDGSRFRVAQEALAKDNDVVWSDRALTSDLGRVLQRRLLPRRDTEYSGKSKQLNNRRERFPLSSAFPAELDDVLAFLQGEVADARVTRLTRALLAVRVDRADRPAPRGSELGELRLDVPAPYAALRVLYSPWSLEEPLALAARAGQPKQWSHPALRVRAHPAPLALLAAGRLEDAAALAVQILKTAGARPKLRTFIGGSEISQRILASLAIPLSLPDISRLAAMVFKPDLVISSQSAPIEPML